MLKILLFLNLIISLSIFLFILYAFSKLKKNNLFKKTNLLLFFLGFVFLICFLIYFFLFLGIFQYSEKAILLIQSILTFFQALFLVGVIYSIRRNSKIFYLFLIYIFFILSIFIGLNFSNFLLLSSLSLIMILFILSFSIPHFERISKFAILYSSISLFLQILLMFQNEFSPIFSLISNSFFFAFLIFFIEDLRRFSYSLYERKVRLKKNYYIFDFLRYFVFLVILTNFIFIGVLSIHEGGHFVVSKLDSDCALQKIVYEGNLPRTEILCANSPGSMGKILLGGLLLPLIIAALFFIAGGTFMKEISLLILGFNILIGFKDFVELGFSKGLSTSFSIFGAFVVLLAIGILAKSRTAEEEFIHFGDS